MQTIIGFGVAKSIVRTSLTTPITVNGSSVVPPRVNVGPMTSLPGHIAFAVSSATSLS